MDRAAGLRLSAIQLHCDAQAIPALKANGKIAFESYRNGKIEVYVINTIRRCPDRHGHSLLQAVITAPGSKFSPNTNSFLPSTEALEILTGSPAWIMVKARPAMMSALVRGAVPETRKPETTIRTLRLH